MTPDVCAENLCNANSRYPNGFHCLHIDRPAANARCMRVDICPTRRTITAIDPEDDDTWDELEDER